MMKPMMGALIIAAVALTGSAASARTKGPTLQDRQQAACYDDVQRLCHDTLPNVAKTEACMKTKRSQVSERCAKMYDAKK